MNIVSSANPAPVPSGERHIILDALRGLALLGICLVNFPEFSLYTFLKGEVISAMPTAGIDKVIRYFQYIFIDGKFYTIFSLLFGTGFSIILSNTLRKQADGIRIFYRRMVILLVIGLLHMMFLWSGDILMLYALLGLLLPLFRNVSNKGLLVASVLFLLLPVGMDAAKEYFGMDPSAAVVRWQQYYCAKYGITAENFGFWLRDTDNYKDVLKFLVQGAFVRMQEFIDGNRYFKVMGLFLLGFYIGRNRLYAHLTENKLLLKRIALYGFMIGLPASVFYAWSAMHGHPWRLAGHSALYAVSVVPLGMAYTAAFCLWYQRGREGMIFKVLAVPGRMALTNYIGQSVLGMIVYYGIGFGLGAGTGLVYVVLGAVAIYLAEIAFSFFWLTFFRFGPLEWMWRMLTYRKWLPLLK